MVIIRYFKYATARTFEMHHATSIGAFLISKDFSKPELLELRFFKRDMLGEEISTEGGDFLSGDYEEVEIFHGAHVPLGPVTPWVPWIIGALFFVAAIVLTPDVSVPNQPNQSSKSATNRLGASSNEPRIGERIDDIFGTIKNHTPPLWQVPYRRGVNDEETEVLFLCVGKGKYEVDLNEIFDGHTKYLSIPGAQCAIYQNGEYPGNGTPTQQIGNDIDEPIGIYRESNDLNPAELLPPNERAVGSPIWSINAAGGTHATLTLTNADDLGVVLTDYFSAGPDLLLIDCHIPWTLTGSRTLYNSYEPGYVFTTETIIDISGSYEITAVTASEITIVCTTWNQYIGPFALQWWVVNSNPYSPGLVFTTFDEAIVEYPPGNSFPVTWWYDDNTFMTEARETFVKPVSDVGQVFDNVLGPITIFPGATKVIVNLTSMAGFYKLDTNEETTITADVEIVVEELVNGTPTGTKTTATKVYSSNPNNTTYSVYRSYDITIPYDNAHIYIRRMTDRDKGDGISNVDKIEWTALYSFEPNPAGVDFGDVTLMQAVIPSNTQSRLVKDRRTNLHLTRKITPYYYNGEFGPVDSYPTDNFAQILIYTALDPTNGRLTLDQINADGLLPLQGQIDNYYNDLVHPGSTIGTMSRFGYDFDSNEISYEDMFTTICNVAGCVPYVQNGVYDGFFEQPQATSAMQVTCRNKIPGTEVREDIFFKEYDGVELTFRNEASGVSEVIYVPEDRTATNAEKVEFAGCVTELQAWRRAWRIRNKQIYKVCNVEFQTDEFGRLIVPGQRIDSPDGTRFTRHTGNTDGYKIYDGEVVEVNGFFIELSEPVEFVEGESHYIQFTNPTGENSQLIECGAVDDNQFEVFVYDYPDEGLYDGYDRDKTKFTFCSEQLRESIALIPQTIEFKMDNSKERNTIASINYDSRYYKDDLGTP